MNFPELLEKIAQIDGIKRIRYTSPHPKDFTPDLLEMMTKYDNICNYIHMPLQAGADSTLKRMNRNYTKKEFLDLVNMIREYIPNCSISTDIIVGFPGDTEAEFQETLNVMNAVKFDSAFTFKYSLQSFTKSFQNSLTFQSL